MTPDDLFEDAVAKKILAAVLKVVGSLDQTTIRTTKSQVAFRRAKNFALLWAPRQYLSQDAAPIALTVSFPTKDKSPRWKEITKVSDVRYTHHLELWYVKDVDAQVKKWLKLAWENAT